MVLDYNFMKESRKMQGHMNELANSIELVLDCILKNKSKRFEMLGKKIKSLKKYLKEEGVELKNNLIERLINFNEVWIFMKHGSVVHNTRSYTFLKDGSFKTITPEDFKELCSEFTSIQGDLLKLNSKFN